MTLDPGTPSGERHRRRSLDDIRQELEAEFSPPPMSEPNEFARPPMRRASEPRGFDEGEDQDEDEIVVPAIRRRRAGGSRWRGYLVAGLVGCMAGQLVLLAYLTMRRHDDGLGTTRVSAPVLRADDAATLSASTQPEAVRAPDASDAVAVEPEAVTPPEEPAPLSVPAERHEAPPPRPVVREDPPRTTAPPPRRVVASTNLAESAAQLRSALSEWIAVSGRRDDAHLPDAEVILGFDGRTAKTRVPMRSGDRMVMREQRWERRASGWNIVADRVVGRESP